MSKEIYLNTKSTKELRHTLYEKNNVCPISNIEDDITNMALDHIHGSHRSIYPITNKLVRNLIFRDVNVMLGKIENQYLRSSKKLKEVPLPELLRNIADYIEYYSDIDNFETKYIHSTEWKPKKIKKSSFNKLKKLVRQKLNKDILYPKSGKETKLIKKYTKELNFDIEFY